MRLPDSSDSGPPVTGVGALARYVFLEELARGGMGEVHRVHDRALNRVVAMKIVKATLADSEELEARFHEEAQIAAQLDHPAIVPVYDFGRLTDGRFWMTMKLLDGRTLADALREMHARISEGRWPDGDGGPTFPRLIQAFHRVCEAMAYAHSRRVIHRDLKPQNIMMGSFGEVYVVDWGLAKSLSIQPALAAEETPTVGERVRHDTAPVFSTPRITGALRDTGYGEMIGTASYMAPEQARGDVANVGPAADVYSLGAVLYELISGEPPYKDGNALAPLIRHCPPVRQVLGPTHPHVPEELLDLCDTAMARHWTVRPADAGELARRLGAWLEGSSRREQAAARLQDAIIMKRRVEEIRNEAHALVDRARSALAALPAYADAEQKLDAWRWEDAAADLTIEARVLEVDLLTRLRSALALAPDMPEIRLALARHHQQAFLEAEERGDRLGAAEHQRLLMTYDTGIFAEWMRGEWTLSLETEPAGAIATLHRFKETDRRLVPVRLRSLGSTPLAGVRLDQGSYLIRLEHPACDPVDLPVYSDRRDGFSLLAPGEVVPRRVRLPRRGDLGPEDRYVTAGYFIAGGDHEALDALPRQRLWVDDFVIRQYPVRNREFLQFLNAPGIEEALLARFVATGEQAHPWAIIRDASGRFTLRGGETPELLDTAVALVDWHACVRYCRWLSQEEGLPWRLPHELEWEKAARGVDGRRLPWGNHMEAGWAQVPGARPGQPVRARVGAFPFDRSVYGVYDMVGGVRDWQLNGWRFGGDVVSGRVVPGAVGEEEPLRAGRGGSWNSVSQHWRPAMRLAANPSWSYIGTGFRIARPTGEGC